MKIVQKNHHLDAAIALLRSKERAKELLRSLEQRANGTYKFLADDNLGFKAVVLAVLNAGATVTLVSSEPRNDGQIQGTSLLIQTACQSYLGSSVRLAQTVMPVGNPRLEQSFATAGFHSLATLNYMERARSSSKLPQKRLEHTRFITMTDLSDSQLGALMQETYIGSLDCPKIHGIRLMQDIINGHRGHGQYDAQLWFIAEVKGTQVGVLLLNPVQEMQCTELAYLGVVPHARGKGVGNTMMHHAIEQSMKQGLPRITLAVDANNLPAIQLYKKWNFHKTKERLTMIRKFC